MSSIEKMYDEIRAYKQSRTITTAIHLGILTTLRRLGPTASLYDLSAELSFAQNWLAAVLRVLMQYGLVNEEEHSYSLTKVGFQAENDQALKVFAGYHFHCFNSWAHLPKAIRSGKGNSFHRQRIKDKDFCRSYLMSMAEIAKSHIACLEQECGDYFLGEILDIGAGPSSFCRYLVQKDRDIKVTALDLPEIVLSAKELFREFTNFEWMPGDFLSWTTSKKFDVVYCGHFLEYCPKEDHRLWLQKIRSLIRGGRYLILVLFLREGNAAETEDLDLFEISTGLNGDNLGYIMNKSEITTALQESGFTKIKIKRLPEGPSYSEYLVTCQTDINKEE